MASPGADSHGRTKSQEDQFGEQMGTLGRKMGTNMGTDGRKKGLPSKNEIQWMSLAGDLLCRMYCASPPSNSFTELWNNLVSFSTLVVPDTVGHC